MSNDRSLPDDSAASLPLFGSWPPPQPGADVAPDGVVGTGVVPGPPPGPPPGYGPQPGYSPQPARASKWGKAGGGAAAGAGIAAKAGFLGKLALLFKGATLLAKFKLAATMLISVAAYSWLFGWRYAVGFVALIAVHEFGHVIVNRAQGVPVSLPTFIPFLGAFVKVAPRSVREEAIGAIAGPVFGTAAAIALLEVSQHSRLLQALAYAGFFINLFNLIPALPFDGGRVAGALHPALWVVGFGGVVALEIWRPTPILLLVLIFGGIEMFRRIRRRAWVNNAYYAMSKVSRAAIGTTYLGVALVCLWGINAAYVPR